MKTLVKLINVNDGNEKVFQNGERIYVESYPRTEQIISAFLSQGWALTSRTQRMNPTVQKANNLSFYLGGWDLLFQKEVEDSAEDDGDEILSAVLSELRSDFVMSENSYTEEDFVEPEDYDSDDDALFDFSDED